MANIEIRYTGDPAFLTGALVGQKYGFVAHSTTTPEVVYDFSLSAGVELSALSGAVFDMYNWLPPVIPPDVFTITVISVGQ